MLGITILALLAASVPCHGASLGQPEIHLGDLSDVRFLLWTRENSGDGDYYHLEHRNSDSLAGSPFSADKTTYFIVHGFQNDGLMDWITTAKTGLLSQVDANVFSVDWGKLCPFPLYPGAVENVYKVGELTGDFIDWLNEETGLAADQVEMSGHSLGAQVSGITGKSVTCGKLGRITGMDPAGPLFYDTGNDQHLVKTDAKFVDIIHTNAGDVADGGIGMGDQLGHQDFYVNGGSHQEGCEPLVPGGDYLDMFEGCSHGRSHEYWSESITATGFRKTFVSWPCSSYEDFENGLCTDCGIRGCPEMGFNVDRNLNGVFYLKTNSESPYALGDSQG